MTTFHRTLLFAFFFVAAASSSSRLFGQDTTPPTLVSKSPPDLSIDVDRLAPIVLTFDEAMKPQGVVTVSPVSGGIAPVSYSWSGNGLTLTCTPISPLPPNTAIIWFLDTATFEDVAGNQLEDSGEESGFYYTGSTATGGGTGGSGTGTNAVTTFQVGKIHFYVQTNAAAPVLDPEIGYAFNAGTTLASNRTATNVTLTLPNANVVRLNRNPSAQEQFFFFDFTTNLTAFESSYPSGNQTFTVRSVNSNQTVVVNLPAGGQPNAPHVANYAAAQSIDASQPFTLTWDPFQGGTAADAIDVSIGDVFNSPEQGRTNALRGTATSITIPAGTLAPGSNYEASIIFIRPVATTNAGYATFTFRSTTTSFQIQTMGTNQTGPPIFLSIPVRTPTGSIRFNVTSAPNRGIQVQYATRITNWVQLLVTNTTAASTTVTDPNPPDAARIYRAHYFTP